MIATFLDESRARSSTTQLDAAWMLILIRIPINHQLLDILLHLCIRKSTIEVNNFEFYQHFTGGHVTTSQNLLQSYEYFIT